MKHDYENIRRGAAIKDEGKTRVTMYLDNDVLEHFRRIATTIGRGYQTLINSELRRLMEEQTSQSTSVTQERTDNFFRSELDMLAARLGAIEQRMALGAPNFRPIGSDPTGFQIMDLGVMDPLHGRVETYAYRNAPWPNAPEKLKAHSAVPGHWDPVQVRTVRRQSKKAKPLTSETNESAPKKSPTRNG